MSNTKLSLGHFVLLAALFGMLIFAVIWASMAWTSAAAVPMSGHGWAALILGVVFSMVIGCGLMALMFYSSHSGHDIVATPNVWREPSAHAQEASVKPHEVVAEK